MDIRFHASQNSQAELFGRINSSFVDCHGYFTPHIEGRTVILQPEDQFFLVIDQAKIDTGPFFTRGEAVPDYIYSQFFKTDSSCISLVRFTA